MNESISAYLVELKSVQRKQFFFFIGLYYKLNKFLNLSISQLTKINN